MIHHPFDDKICDVANGKTTNACVEYFDIKNSMFEKFDTSNENILKSTRYVNYHKDFLTPSFVGFTKLNTFKYSNRIRQTYGYKDDRTQNVGLYWKRRDLSQESWNEKTV